MREILFRGKRIDNGEWVYGYYIRYGWTHQEKDYIVPLYASDLYAKEVIPETIGQYTGLTDKNGKKIFEGDVCKNTKTGEIVSVQWHGTMAGYVWSKRKENNQHLFDFGELFRAYDKYEVIGNIHDNPELLEGSVGNENKT